MARVTFEGIRKFERKFSQRINFLGERGMREFMKDVGAEVRDSYARRMASFTPGDVPDLTENYKPRKSKRFGRIYPILIASGAMLASLYSRVYRGPPWKVRIGWAGQHEGGLRNAELAAIHANGEGTAPKRDFTKLPPGWSKRWVKELSDRLRRQK